MKVCVLAFALILSGCRLPGVTYKNPPPPQTEIGHEIPGLKDGAVPQGLAYLSDQNLLLISYYHTDGRPSVIRVMDWMTGQVTHKVELLEIDNTPHCGHVGGIAVASSNLWIASDAYLYQFDLNDILQRDRAVAISAYRTEATEEVAFCTYRNEALWAGEFSLKTKFPTPAEHHLSDREGARRGGWISAHTYASLQVDGMPATPSKALSIPDKTQDAQFTDEYIILSRSYGRRSSSVIEVYKNPLTEAPHRIVQTHQGSDIPLWFLDGSNLVHAITLPPMTENIEIIDNRLVILFESGAKKYRRFGRAPQDRFMILNLNELF